MKIILAIDDEKSTLSLLTSQLEGQRYRIFTETSPVRGIDMARTLNPDVILLDVNMPGINGIEALKKLKKDSITQHIPVIMLTAVSDKEIVMKAMAQGVSDYIVKPWDHGKLLIKVSAAVKYREMILAEYKLDNSNFINISRLGDIVMLTFTERPSSNDFKREAKTVFNSFFLGQLKVKIVVIDLRMLGEFDSADAGVLENIAKILSEGSLSIICGRHYGEIVAVSDIEEHANLFISHGDMEVYLQSIGKG